MARVQEQVLIVKVSKLLKDRDSEQPSLIDTDFIDNAESVLQQLVGENYTIEVVADL